MERFYPIGTPGEPWTEADRRAWFEQQTIQRSYADEVLAALEEPADRWEVVDYGSLPIDSERYPLKAVRVRSTNGDAPWVLITGGVHGYETSGVQGALEVLRSAVDELGDRVNLLVAPCVSPWGYEVINRWNPDAIDPNRSFYADSPSEEAAALMRMVEAEGVDFLVHMDLHETTDSDEEEFRPALAARNGVASEPGLIPDGFYTVGDTENPQPGFQAAVIAGSKRSPTSPRPTRTARSSDPTSPSTASSSIHYGNSRCVPASPTLASPRPPRSIPTARTRRRRSASTRKWRQCEPASSSLWARSDRRQSWRCMMWRPTAPSARCR